MTKITLTDLANLQNETTAVNAINANNAVIETASNNTLSRDGTSPNQMNATLDMNSQQIINLPVPSSNNSPARLIDVVSNPTIVVPGTGTSGHVVPFLDGNNTFTGTNHIAALIVDGNTTQNGGTNSVAGVTTFAQAPVFPANAIPNASLATMAANTAKGSIAGGTPIDLTKTQLTTLVNPVTSALSGAAPASGGGTANFLRADATWVPPPASAMTLIETLTPTAVASVPTTVLWTGSFASYEIVFINVIPATNLVNFEMQVHSGGAYQTANYANSTFGTPASTTVLSNGAITTYIALNANISNGVGNAGAGLSGVIRIVNPAGASVAKHVTGTSTHSQTATTCISAVISGFWANPGAIDGAQFLFSSGNITSGVIKIYGIT